MSTLVTNQCKFCCHIFAGDLCPRCESAHQKASKLPPVPNIGHRKGAASLDMQEGNWEEWHGGFDFPGSRYRT